MVISQFILSKNPVSRMPLSSKNLLTSLENHFHLNPHLTRKQHEDLYSPFILLYDLCCLDLFKYHLSWKSAYKQHFTYNENKDIIHKILLQTDFLQRSV